MAFSQAHPVFLAGDPHQDALDHGYGVVIGTCPFGTYPSYGAPSLEELSVNNCPALSQPVYANVVKYRPPIPFRPESLSEQEETRSRVNELQRQAWTQAQIIREQSNMLAMAWDPRLTGYYVAFPQNPRIVHTQNPGMKFARPRRVPPIKKKEAKAKPDPHQSEKRAQAKQFKTFVRTHFTVRAAFRLIHHFLPKEEKDKFLADTQPYLVQFAHELKSSTPGALVTQGLARAEQTEEFAELSYRHLRPIIALIKQHDKFVDCEQNKENEEAVEISLTDKHEGRVGFSRLMIYAIAAFGAEGDTRLHQVAALLRKLQIDMSEDPDLISAILDEAESRAKNYEMFCSSKVGSISPRSSVSYKTNSLSPSHRARSNSLMANSLSPVHRARSNSLMSNSSLPLGHAHPVINRNAPSFNGSSVPFKSGAPIATSDPICNGHAVNYLLPLPLPLDPLTGRPTSAPPIMSENGAFGNSVLPTSNGNISKQAIKLPIANGASNHLESKAINNLSASEKTPASSSNGITKKPPTKNNLAANGNGHHTNSDNDQTSEIINAITKLSVSDGPMVKKPEEEKHAEEMCVGPKRACREKQQAIAGSA